MAHSQKGPALGENQRGAGGGYHMYSERKQHVVRVSYAGVLCCVKCHCVAFALARAAMAIPSHLLRQSLTSSFSPQIISHGAL